MNDFQLYCRKFCKIVTTQGEVLAFTLNRVQRRLLHKMLDQWQRTGRIRIIVLKARQQGFSTFMQAFCYWWASFRSNKKAYVVADDLTTTKSLFRTLKNTHKEMHPDLRPAVERSNSKELVFGELNTSIALDTAGGDALGRGQTFSFLWLSELAYWPPNKAQDNLSGVLTCCHDLPGNICVVESTAAGGVTGPYYDLYQGAPDNGFETFFAPWYHSEHYTIPDDEIPADFGVHGSAYEYTIEELDMLDGKGLTEPLTRNQLWFRRKTLARIGREAWLKDFPAVESDAFQHSGNPAFDIPGLVKMKSERKPVLREMNYDEVEDKFIEADYGGLKLFGTIDKNQRYYIGADVAGGRSDGDWSVAQVLNGDREQVAVYRAKIGMRHFAKVLYALGMLFNEAEIAMEINNLGHTTMERLAHQLHYPNLWRRINDGKVDEEESELLGFFTTNTSKPMIIGALQEHIRTGGIKIHDEKTFDEMFHFVAKRSGSTVKYEADVGHHDDCVMALAIGSWVNEGNWMPVEVKDSDYVAAY